MHRFGSGPTSRRVTLVLITLLILTGLIACGGSSTKSTPQTGGNTTPPPAVAITATCNPTTVPMGGTTACTATVTNATDTSVTWAITEANSGTFASGTYTAPAKVTADTTVHLVATSKADTTKTATVTLTVKAASIVATCDKTSLVTGGTAKCSATVSGASNTAVTWAVDGGTFDATKGVYTAPAKITDNPTKYTLVATSTADTAKTASVELTVKNPIVITITPVADVHIKTSQVFDATVTGAIEDSSLIWTLTEGDVAGKLAVAENGTVTYTAPDKVTGCTPSADGKRCIQTVHVVATSKEDSQFKAEAAVKVYALAPTYAALPCPEATADHMVCTTSANQGDLWKYQFAAADPEGGTVAIAMTTAPDGAHIETNSTDTIAWIPTAAESRTENAFALKATSTSGAYTTQAWTIIPSGIVSGVMNDKYLSATGVKSIPVDLSEVTISALVVDETGATVADLPGVGKADGTFSIEKVPGGKYFLYMDRFFTTVESTVSQIDLSQWWQGRQDVKAAAEGTTRKIHFDGLLPWADGDSLNWSIPNTGEWNSWSNVLPDTITYDTTENVQYLADAAAGDRAFAGQFVRGTTAGGRDYYRLAKSLAFDVTDLDGKELAISKTVEDLPGSVAFQPVVKGSAFTALNSAMSPSAPTQTYTGMYLETHPFGLDNGYVSYGPSLFEFSGSNETAVSTDVDFGTLTYSNPYPTTWPLILEYDHETLTPIAGTPYSVYNEIFQITDAIPTTASPVTPAVGPVTKAKIGDGDFFATATVTGNPKLSWSAPEVGTAQGYDVTVIDVTASDWYRFRTAATELIVPANIIVAGHSYVFQIYALNEGDKDLNVTPFEMGFPHAYASASSGLITIQAAPTPTVQGSASGVAKKFVARKLATGTSIYLGSAPRRMNKSVLTPRHR